MTHWFSNTVIIYRLFSMQIMIMRNNRDNCYYNNMVERRIWQVPPLLYAHYTDYYTTIISVVILC